MIMMPIMIRGIINRVARRRRRRRCKCCSRFERSSFVVGGGNGEIIYLLVENVLFISLYSILAKFIIG
jgi:hypothetical protein